MTISVARYSIQISAPITIFHFLITGHKNTVTKWVGVKRTHFISRCSRTLAPKIVCAWINRSLSLSTTPLALQNIFFALENLAVVLEIFVDTEDLAREPTHDKLGSLFWEKWFSSSACLLWATVFHFWIPPVDRDSWMTSSNGDESVRVGGRRAHAGLKKRRIRIRYGFFCGHLAKSLNIPSWRLHIYFSIYEDNSNNENNIKKTTLFIDKFRNTVKLTKT